MMPARSLFPYWMSKLTLQEQAVLILALRGPDGDPKHTGYKTLLRAMRGCVIKSARYGRMLRLNERERTGNFMDTTLISDTPLWHKAVADYLENEADAAVLHTYTHFMHAAQVLSYHHPLEFIRDQWRHLYTEFAHRLHLEVEAETVYRARLSDWRQKEWSPDASGREREAFADFDPECIPGN